jgi:hypothetical protein
MFQFPTFASHCWDIQVCTWMGCPIRTSPDQRLFAPPRSFSQLVTSFFASESQGIHHSLLCNFCCSYSYSIIIFTGNPLMTLLPKAKSQNRLPALIVFSYVYLPSMSKIVVASLKAGGYRLLAYGSWHFLNANSQRPITNS